MILGMAGHIDHGKSALATALTGVTMDRLAEERRRGITLDLNFAPLDLGDGVVVGLVDVPGHEDLVRTMIAGATGVGLAVLVVAADEGIMPQTLEHLAILEHLRVPLGIPVVTKADLASPEEARDVAATLADRLATSPVAFDPPIIVSARTGQGIDALRDVIGCLAARAGVAKPGSDHDLFRMPIDRAFSLAGVGTVVTGTVWSGSVAPGETVTILPAGLQGRVRSLESHGRGSARGHAGSRVAVGLAGVAREAVARGAVLVAQGAPWPVTTRADVMVALQPTAPRPLVSRTRIRLLLGTVEVMARVQPLDPIEPAGSGRARITLERPTVVRGGDRFVLRSYSPVTTIGGGVVLDPLPRGSLWPPGLGATNAAHRFSALLERRPAGIPAPLLPLLLGLPPGESAAAAGASGIASEGSGRWLAEGVVDAARRRALEALSRHHAARPGSPGMPLETLRQALGAPAPVVEQALARLERSAAIRMIAGGVVVRAGFAPEAPAREDEIGRLVGAVQAAGLMPPTLGELARVAGGAT